MPLPDFVWSPILSAGSKFASLSLPDSRCVQLVQRPASCGLVLLPVDGTSTLPSTKGVDQALLSDSPISWKITVCDWLKATECGGILLLVPIPLLVERTACTVDPLTTGAPVPWYICVPHS